MKISENPKLAQLWLETTVAKNPSKNTARNNLNIHETRSDLCRLYSHFPGGWQRVAHFLLYQLTLDYKYKQSIFPGSRQTSNWQDFKLWVSWERRSNRISGFKKIIIKNLIHSNETNMFLHAGKH